MENSPSPAVLLECDPAATDTAIAKPSLGLEGNRKLAFRWILVAAVVLAILSGLRVQAIPVPKGSFESPATTFVSTHIDSWQKTPQPPSYVNSSGYTWDELTGVFANTASGQSDHINNLDGNQAAYLFAIPQVGFFQDYNSVDWQNLPPTHAFNATYGVGNSYTLTIGLNGGGGNMQQGASLLLSLYYLDGGGNQVTVASTSVVNTAGLFPTHTAMTDFEVHVPVVQASDPWAGQHLGVAVYSTVSSDMQGGYWDVDNARLSAAPTPEPGPAALLFVGLGSVLIGTRGSSRGVASSRAIA